MVAVRVGEGGDGGMRLTSVHVGDIVEVEHYNGRDFRYLATVEAKVPRGLMIHSVGGGRSYRVGAREVIVHYKRMGVRSEVEA